MKHPDPLEFTEEELAGLLSSPNGNSVGTAILDSASWGRTIVISMQDGLVLRFTTADHAQAALRRFFAWPALEPLPVAGGA